MCNISSSVSICPPACLKYYPHFPPCSPSHFPVPFNQICPIFTPPPPLCWALLVILGFGEGAQWQRWHLFEGLAVCQPLSITPATRVTLLDLSPTNLSADALCGCKTSGHSIFGIRTAKVPMEDLKMGWWKPLSRFYNAEEVRLLLRKKQVSEAGGWSTQRIESAKPVQRQWGTRYGWIRQRKTKVETEQGKRLREWQRSPWGKHNSIWSLQDVQQKEWREKKEGEHISAPDKVILSKKQ